MGFLDNLVGGHNGGGHHGGHRESHGDNRHGSHGGSYGNCLREGATEGSLASAAERRIRRVPVSVSSVAPLSLLHSARNVVPPFKPVASFAVNAERQLLEWQFSSSHMDKVNRAAKPEFFAFMKVFE